MKLLLFVLSAAIFTTGCTQPKNRLTDDKNTQYQEKQAKAKKSNQTPEKHTVDVPAPNAQASDIAKTTPIEKTPAIKNEVEEVKQNSKDEDIPVIPARAELIVEEKAVDTAASREQAKNDIAKATGATENKPEPKSGEAAKEAAKTDTNKLSLVEVRSILTQVFKLVNDRQAAIQSIQEYNSEGSGISFDKLSFDLDINTDNANIAVLHDNQTLAKFENIQVKYDVPVVKTSNEISLLSVCINESCDLMMLTIRKVIKEKFIYNFPLFIKIVNDQIIRFSLKSSEEYSKEAAAVSQPEKSVPAVEPLNLSEYSLVFEQLTRTKVVKSDEELKRISTLYISPSLKMDAKKILTGIGSNNDGIIFLIGYDGQEVTRATKVKLKFGEAFKAKTEEGYNFSAVCGNEKCSVIFVAFTKVEDNKTVANLPLYFRVINDRIVQANIKSDEEYKAEAREKLKSDNKK